jgi:hypothetical protein
LAAWSTLALVLGVCVPLWLRLPPWMDNTFFDICARAVLEGRILYRDVLVHSPPGMVLTQAAIRGLCGWGSATLGVVDLIFFSATAALLVWHFPFGPARIWTVVILYLWYFSTPESCHCQQDPWMLLLALTGLSVRHQQMAAMLQNKLGVGVCPRAFVEGLFWGLAFTIKPCVIVPAACCSLVRTGGLQSGPLSGAPGRSGSHFSSARRRRRQRHQAPIRLEDRSLPFTGSVGCPGMQKTRPARRPDGRVAV